ncbi:MAG: MoaD/ThiS family protein [Nitrospirota bacterium]|nr:MoaD/ThiS family protein [Nitrospirota bacterium]MDH5586240.1 MoaD/ThiS family protein [Nitrospirota bacterium]MDH5775682.1 MoaD/ThiS family protein [Nitrospirota bacterium]
MVKVLLFGHALREAVEDPEMEIALEESVSLRQMMETYQEQFQDIMPFLHSQELMFTINQKISTLDGFVKNGDTVKITHQGGDQSADGARWHNP